MFLRIKSKLKHIGRRDTRGFPGPTVGHDGGPNGVGSEAALPTASSPASMELRPKQAISSITESRAPVQNHATSQPSDPDTSKDGESGTTSLWNQAFAKLEEEKGTLVKEYRELLWRELSTPKSSTGMSIAHDEDCSDLGGTTKQVCADSSLSKAQLDEIMERGKRRLDKPRSQYTIAGHKFNLKQQVAKAAQFVLWGQTLVDQAVKASAEASLIWAGVCLVLPLLTHPYLAAQANESGFNHVTARMNFYVALEPRLLPKNANITEEVKRAFQRDILDLYQHILEFQLSSVLRFYNSSVKRALGDVKDESVWDTMLSQVTADEEKLERDFKLINDTVVRDELLALSNTATGSLARMCQLLSVNEKQLEQTILTNEILSEITLPTVPDALYDSAAVSKHTRRCHKDTRRSVLEIITAWVNAAEGEAIFWLHGPAGMGKSTIARTLVDDLTTPRDPADIPQLGASYFFSKLGRSGSDRFFPTIASRLMASSPEFKSCLIESLRRSGDTKSEVKKIDKKALETQFEVLIKKPLEMIYERMASEGCLDRWTRVVVIDALDECQDDENMSTICALLVQLQELAYVRLRVVLTSRDVPPIRAVFRNAKLHSLSLLDARFRDETKKDVGIVLRKMFDSIKDSREIMDDTWPDPTVLENLLTFATDPQPLFIYVSTLGRFLADDSENPKDQLTLWLEQDTNESQLVQIYTPIFTRLLFVRNPGGRSRPISKKAEQKLRQILGAIILLVTPLSVPALASLLDMDLLDINIWLPKLRPVLNVPDGLSTSDAPLEVVHKSLRDFLLGQAGPGSNGFRVDAEKTHEMLASKCIHRLRREYDGLLTDEPDNAVNSSMPAHLDYAHLSWMYHFQRSGRSSTARDEADGFLQTLLPHIRDVDYFDSRCQQLCAHVQHWVLALSKSSEDCRLTCEIHDVEVIHRLNSAVLDGSDPDRYLEDRVKRSDIFMSVTTNIICESIFGRYLFGMDPKRRQELKSRETLLRELGPPQAVHQWRSATLTLLSRGGNFNKQRDRDTEAVVQAILETLGAILPPPRDLEEGLRSVVSEAAELAILMRCQRAEYMMLSPVDRKYDADGELVAPMLFNARLMEERSGVAGVSHDELEAAGAGVRLMLFPIVIMKGDDEGAGDEEAVVFPAQVIVTPRAGSKA